jgi:hypothetical protein
MLLLFIVLYIFDLIYQIFIVQYIGAQKASPRQCARVVNGLDLNLHIQSSNGFGLASSNLVIVVATFSSFCFLYRSRGGGVGAGDDLGDFRPFFGLAGAHTALTTGPRFKNINHSQ